MGHKVFVPHEAPYNEKEGASPSEIFRQDFTAMMEADACVAVGALGVDCAFEVGWFTGRGKPVIWVLSDMHKKESPMLSGTRRIDSVIVLKEVLK
jgi:nucleoside 2-deoxyribosyltransferase